MKRLVLFLTLLLFASIQILQAQAVEITGTITSSEDGSPVPGASIIVKGTTIGTVSSSEGTFTLRVPADATELVVSFVGMKTQDIRIEGRTTIDIVMEPDILGLDEVVVTALGITRERKALGYSVQDVSGESIAQSKETNIVNTLQGKLAGVQITNADGGVASGSRIIVRGLASLTVGSNNQPLFVVDGIPISNSYSQPGAYGGGTDFGNAAMDLNPADIENISVLKGANAAALYGQRAVNGVVLITTKTGASKSQRGIGVSFESNWMWDNILVLPKYQNKYGQGSDEMFAYVNGRYGGVADGVDESWGPPLDYIVQEEDLQPGGRLYWTQDTDPATAVVSEPIPQTVGQILVLPQWDSPYDPETGVRTPTPWVSRPDNIKNFFETGHRITQNLSLQGSSDVAHFRLSYSNMDVKGTMPNTDLKKNTVNLSAGYNVTRKLNVGGTVTYINNSSDNIVQNGYDAQNPMQSLGQWFGRQINTENLRKLAGVTDPITGFPMNWNHSYHNNPYWVLHKELNSRNRDRIIGNINMNYQFTDWLSFKSIIGTDWYIEDRSQITAKGDVEDREGHYWAGSYRRNEMTANGAFTFEKDFGENFSLLASLGGEINKYDYQYHSTSIPDLIVPDLYAVSNAAADATTGLSETHREYQSVFGNVNLGFSDFLFLDFTGRNDWSSTLPVDNNSYFYPSVSLGAVITEALGVQSDIFSYAKLRASYAEVGGSASPYQLMGTFDADNPFNGQPTLTYTNTIPPLGLKPQRKKSIELGADLKFLRNRLGLDVTLYKENTINQILNIAISRTTGFSSKTINAGNLQNKGVEVQLYASPVRTPDFNWDINVNWSANENLVVDLYEDMEYLYLYSGSWNAQIHARPGEKYGILWGYAIVRENQEKVYYDEAKTRLSHILYSGRPVVTTSGYYIRSNARTDLGCVYPDWFGGVNNAFQYKNVTASFLVDFRKGGVIYSITDWFGCYAGVLEKTAAVNDNGVNIREPVADGGGIKVEGVYGYVDANGDVQFTDADGNDVSSPVENTTYANASNFYHDYWGKNEVSVFDASFVKLREVTLGYTFRNLPALQRVGIQSLNLSLIGRNLWIIHKNTPDIDPEINMGAGNYVGMETNAIPSVRSMGFNVKVNF